MAIKTVSIIGAGASGILVLAHLVEGATPGRPAKIYLIEKEKDFGPGLAYRTPLDAHILNMRVDTMSAFPEDQDHFTRWLADAQKTDATALMDRESYTPRKVYGDYLKEILSKTIRKAESLGIQVECIQDEAVTINRTTDGQTVTFPKSPAIRSDAVVLALGNFPSTVLSELRGLPGYFDYPWPVEPILKHLSGNEPVAIVGSGLSAIDALHTVLAAGQREKIYFVSRNGWLPKVRSDIQAYPLRFLTRENIHRLLTAKGETSLTLEDVSELLFQELEAAEGNAIDRCALMTPAGNPLEILEEDLARARRKSIPYQNALVATELITGEVWDLLSFAERSRFICNYKSLWTVYRHPMPPANAEKVVRVLKSGQLEVLGGLQKICHGPFPGSFSVETVSPLGAVHTLEVGTVINATGQGLDVRKFDSLLVKQLLSEGIAFPHPNGGLRVDFATGRVTGPDGKPSDSLFAVGELTKGVHFLTNGISCCARRAQDIAASILESA